MLFKKQKYILFCFAMIIPIALIFYAVMYNSDHKSLNISDSEGTYNSIDLSFISEDAGWAVESNGYASDIFMTDDGGENWQKVSSFNYNIIQIFFLNALDGWAITQSSNSNSIEYLFLKTEDGGKTFKNISNTDPNGNIVASGNTVFISSSVGYAVCPASDEGDFVIKTTDQGNTWNQILPVTGEG